MTRDAYREQVVGKLNAAAESAGRKVVRCGCPVNEIGDIRCHNCRQRVNQICWNCKTPRGEGPCPNPREEKRMTEQVDPMTLRPGDLVRVTDVVNGVVDRIIEHNDGSMSVAFVGWAGPYGVMVPNDRFARTWELIERPKPVAKLGSVWVDPEQDEEWVALRDGRYARAGGGVGSPLLAGPWNDYGRAVIARLVPAEEQAEVSSTGMAQCAARLYEHRCGLGPDHDGMHNDGRGHRWIEQA